MTVLIWILLILPWGIIILQYYHFKKSKKLFQQQINQVALPYFKSQMNPHFIKNVLQTLNYLILCDTRENANQCLKKFSVLVDKTLRHAEIGLISLSEEIELLSAYIELQHIRFPDKFDFIKDHTFKNTIFVGTDIDPDEWYIPPMLIQPFVENAIVHGLEPMEEKGALNISFDKNGSQLRCVISDDGIGRKASADLKHFLDPEKRHIGIGMRNIKNRIAVLERAFKIDIGFFVEDLNKEERTGTKVIIEVPANLGRLEEFKVIEFENLILNK